MAAMTAAVVDAQSSTMKRDVIVILPILLVLRDRARLAHCFLATGHRQELSVGSGKLKRPCHSRHHLAG
jgi:hypothetical protein